MCVWRLVVAFRYLSPFSICVQNKCSRCCVECVHKSVLYRNRVNLTYYIDCKSIWFLSGMPFVFIFIYSTYFQSQATVKRGQHYNMFNYDCVSFMPNEHTYNFFRSIVREMINWKQSFWMPLSSLDNGKNGPSEKKTFSIYFMPNASNQLSNNSNHHK